LWAHLYMATEQFRHWNVCAFRYLAGAGCCIVKKQSYTPWWRLAGEEVYVLLILDLGTRWGERSASRLSRALASGKGPPGTHCIEGWVGPRAGLDTEARKILSPLPGIEARSLGRPVRSQTLY